MSTLNYKQLKELTAEFHILASKQPYHIGDSNIHGKGIFAKHPIMAGDNLGIAIAVKQNITPIGQYINHQFSCNARLIENIAGEYELVAIKDISPGEEITVNYKQTPWFISKNTKGYSEF